MRYFEIVLLFLTAVALGWFYFLFPGGAFILMLTMTIVALIYFALGAIIFSNVGVRAAFQGQLKNVPGVQIGIGVFTGLALSTLSIAILFKSLLMPGANEMLFIGCFESVVLIMINVVYFFRTKSASATLVISRLLIFLIPALVLLVTPQLTIVKWQYRNHPLYVNAYSEFVADPANEEKWERLDLEHNRVILSPEEFERYEMYERNR